MEGQGRHVRVGGEWIGQCLNQFRRETVGDADHDRSKAYPRQSENGGPTRRQHDDRLTEADVRERAQALRRRRFRRQHHGGHAAAGRDSDRTSAAKVGQSALDGAEAYRLPGQRHWNDLQAGAHETG